MKTKAIHTAYRDTLCLKSAEVFLKMRKPLLALMELELVSEPARKNKAFQDIMRTASRMCRCACLKQAQA